MRFGIAARVVGWVLLGLCVVTSLIFLMGLPIMALWNWLMPTITKGAVTEVTYFQAVGIYTACHLLFKSHHDKFATDKKGQKQPHLLERKILGLLRNGNEEAGKVQPN